MCKSDPAQDQFVSSWALGGYQPSQGFLANGLGIGGLYFLFNSPACSNLGLQRVYCVSYLKHNPFLRGLQLTPSWTIRIGSLLNLGLLKMAAFRVISQPSTRWEQELEKSIREPRAKKFC